MININIDNLIKTKLPKNLESNLILYLDKKLINLKKDIKLDIMIVSSKKIKLLNNKIRNINEPTDVLSFPIYKNITDIKKSPVTIIELGDIVICPEIAQKNIDDYHLSTDENLLTFLAIHGLKHLLGIHHK